MKYSHKPVMVSQVIRAMKIHSGDTVVDGTAGEGGHAEKIAGVLGGSGVLVLIDRDKEMLSVAEERLSGVKTRLISGSGSYAYIKPFLRENCIDRVSSVLLDLGFSKRHIEKSGRGMSFLKNELLDMRYDPHSGEPAYRWINRADKKELLRVIKRFGQERNSKRVAEEIVRKRKEKPIMYTRELAEIAALAAECRKNIHPATKTFQAIRIYINDELGELRRGMKACCDVIKKGGRLVLLTYHSLEAKVVKGIFSELSGKCGCPENFPLCRCGADRKRPLIKEVKVSGKSPTATEISENPSARSAKMRVFEILKEKV